MKALPLALAATAALLGAAFTVPAQAAPSLAVSDAIYHPGAPPLLQKAQYYYGGRNYCWYNRGWHGPGYYWCGYAGRRGYGWGGGHGWRGWGRPGYGHGRPGYHGGGRDHWRGDDHGRDHGDGHRR